MLQEAVCEQRQKNHSGILVWSSLFVLSKTRYRPSCKTAAQKSNMYTHLLDIGRCPPTALPKHRGDDEEKNQVVSIAVVLRN
jgi:hypothetical protein